MSLNFAHRPEFGPQTCFPFQTILYIEINIPPRLASSVREPNKKTLASGPKNLATDFLMTSLSDPLRRIWVCCHLVFIDQSLPSHESQNVSLCLWLHPLILPVCKPGQDCQELLQQHKTPLQSLWIRQFSGMPGHLNSLRSHQCGLPGLLLAEVVSGPTPKGPLAPPEQVPLRSGHQR